MTIPYTSHIDTHARIYVYIYMNSTVNQITQLFGLVHFGHCWIKDWSLWETIPSCPGCQRWPQIYPALPGWHCSGLWPQQMAPKCTPAWLSRDHITPAIKYFNITLKWIFPFTRCYDNFLTLKELYIACPHYLDSAIHILLYLLYHTYIHHSCRHPSIHLIFFFYVLKSRFQTLPLSTSAHAPLIRVWHLFTACFFFLISPKLNIYFVFGVWHME